MNHSHFGRMGIVAGALVLAAGLLPAVQAAPIVALTPNITTGTQTFNNLFGMDFDAVADVVVTQLGVFDNADDGILLTNSSTQPVVIQLWNRDTGVALAALNFGGGSDNGTRIAAGVGHLFVKDLLAPLTLTGGGHYYLSADYLGTEKFGNVNNPGYTTPTINDGGGLISFVGKGRASNGHGAVFGGSTAVAPFTNSGFIDAGPANRYTAANLVFETPEPSAGLLLAAGAALALCRRRR